MNSLRTRFHIELRHASFLMLRILFDKGVDIVAVCVSVLRVTGTGIKRSKAWSVVLHGVMLTDREEARSPLPSAPTTSTPREGGVAGGDTLDLLAAHHEQRIPSSPPLLRWRRLQPVFAGSGRGTKRSPWRHTLVLGRVTFIRLLCKLYISLAKRT